MITNEIQPIGIEIPLDVQRLVFEEAARLSNNTAMDLLVLCKYVHPWIESVLYESVVLSGSDRGIQFSRTCMDKPASFFAANVKALCFIATVRTEDVVRALKCCSNVKFLGLWNPNVAEDPMFKYTMAQLRLIRVSLGHALFMALAPESRVIFSHTTHFELVLTFNPGNDALSMLKSMPALTHICISYMFPSTGTDITPFLTALTENPKLEVILLLFDNVGLWFFEPLAGDGFVGWMDGSRDKRVVFASDYAIAHAHVSKWIMPGPDRDFCNDWMYRLPEGHRGTWEAAEDMVASRRR